MAGYPGSKRGLKASLPTIVNRQELSHNSRKRNNNTCNPEHGLSVIVFEKSFMASGTFIRHEVTYSNILIKL